MSVKNRLQQLERRAAAADPTEIKVRLIDDSELPAARKRAAADPDYILVELGWGDDHA
jgi:hypothetical protein